MGEFTTPETSILTARRFGIRQGSDGRFYAISDLVGTVERDGAGKIIARDWFGNLVAPDQGTVAAAVTALEERALQLFGEVPQLSHLWSGEQRAPVI